MKKQFWIIALALMTAPAAAANDQSLLSTFVGNWQAEGEAFGAPSTSEMVWNDTVLSGKFFRLEYRINRPASGGPQTIFSGLAYYQKSTNKQFQAFWADTNGNLHPVSATIKGQALISEWGTADSEQGRTRYQLKGHNVLEVTDWVKTQDGMRQFNHTVFSRSANKP